MKTVKILRTSAKHYAEKKLRTFALPPLRRRKLIKQTRQVFIHFKVLQNMYYPSINHYNNADQLPPAILEFARCFIAADWKLDISKPHDFMVTQKIWINSIINN